MATAAATAYKGTFHGRAEEVSRVRREVALYLGDCPVRDDIVLIADEMAANCIIFFPLCFRVAMAIIGGKRTCGLRCSTTSSSLPLVTEPRETGQPATGQGQLRHGYHRTRRVRREVIHTRSRGGSFRVRCEMSPGSVRVEAEDMGGPWRKRRNDDRPHGLDIVEALTGADGWGTKTTSSGGRIVWAVLTW
jgi:hypothetical protein